MGRVPIICKHGIRGISNCKICQREQHTARVRKLREKRKRLEEQERALEKKWNRENVKVFMNDSGKATGRDAFITREPEPSMAKNIERNPSGCGLCRLRDILDCNVYKRFANTPENPCKDFKPWKGVK